MVCLCGRPRRRTSGRSLDKCVEKEEKRNDIKYLLKIDPTENSKKIIRNEIFVTFEINVYIVQNKKKEREMIIWL